MSGPALALPPVLRLGRGREARGTRREALHLVLQVKGEEEPAAEAAAEVDFGSKKKVKTKGGKAGADEGEVEEEAKEEAAEEAEEEEEFDFGTKKKVTLTLT